MGREGRRSVACSDMASLFTRIIRGEVPASFVWRDERCVGFLSINPLNPGHTLVVPVDEIDHWLDCPRDLMSHLLEVAGNIGRAQMAIWKPLRIGLKIEGLEVPHLHAHVSPIFGGGDLDFRNAARFVERGELEAVASSIRDELEAMGFPGGAGGAGRLPR